MSDAATPQQAQSTEAELIAIRREKLGKLRDLGVDPFGSSYEVSDTPANLRANFEEGRRVKIAGRITALRDMGKSVFFSVGDIHGSIQGYLGTKGLDEAKLAEWKCLDRGDWIGIEGETFVTRTGEPTVKVEDFTVLSKSLRPMPDKFHGLSDRETKYRKRHLDLMGNPESASVFVTRSRMVAEIRNFFHQRDYLEVETPMLQSVAGGAAARPFETFHNALGMDLTLRIAPELFLKRLLVGGFTKVFELNRNFRNEGISRRHNPEFTMLEAYQAFADFEIMANLVEELTCHLAETFCGGLTIEHKDEDGNVTRTIDLSRPWKRANYHDLVKGVAGDDFFDVTPEQRRAKCDELGVQISPEMEDYEVIQQVFEKKVEEHTFDPCFVTRVPSELIPLAKLSPGGKTVEVYELIINGQEISPGYSELNDPDFQRQRLEHQAGGEEEQKVDYDFIETLESGMPPAGGIGIGIDRLIMMLTGAPTIRDVVLFPLLKKKES
ncbi:MAG: lysine--tRNA ligase [Akkermansiaceae bacterium]|nr:lysine--tRNA ligase [Akkermansiaceae bacterium]MCP5544293.1 lysine--tRNA ligase [Akkermansiaceae bacterium]MCP5546983.1 lysine--tRNA ligase [Akkermansiaceae bacterium]